MKSAIEAIKILRNSEDNTWRKNEKKSEMGMEMKRSNIKDDN